MTRINLYPWRIELDEQKKQSFFIVLGAFCCLTLCSMFFMSWYYSIQVNQQVSNNEYLNNEIILINKKLREVSEIKTQTEAVLSRLAVIGQLDQNRYGTINLFNEIVSLINPMVVLKQIKRKNNEVKITGYSESNTGVAKFLRSIELSENFNSAELNQIKVIEQNNRLKTDELEFKNYFELEFFEDYKDLIKEQKEDA